MALLVMMLAVVCTPWPARAQPGADEPLEVPVHPAVTTVFHLPDEIEYARFTAPVAGTMRATHSGHMLIVRPQRRVRAGTIVSLEVKTATVRERYRLRVTRHARDAKETIVVQAAEAPPAGAPVRDGDEAAPDDQAMMDRDEAVQDHDSAPEGAHAAPDDGDTARTPPEPAASAPRADRELAPSVPSVASVPGARGPVTAAAAAETIEPVTPATRAPRFELAVHALVALPGFTSLALTGAQPGVTWRAHRGLGVRIAAGPANGWWDVEADVSGTWLAGTLTYEATFPSTRLEVSGPWLRAELGVRAQLGARWRPSVYAGIGAQAHLRRTRAPRSPDASRTTATMEDGAVLALGVGLHRRVGDVLLGVDVQVRRGGPDDYRSMTALWTVGYVLDPGE
jgi:hypothetical protein